MGFLDSVRRFFNGTEASLQQAAKSSIVHGYRAGDVQPTQHSNATRRLQTDWVMEGVNLTPQFRDALALMENTNKHLLITGGAGTGKSTLLKLFVSRTSKRVSVLAPTGIAALNAGGATIHSFAQLPPRLINSQVLNEIRPSQSARRLIRELDAVIIDEISMARADVLDGLHRYLRIARGSNRPFGGVQMIFVGDLFQLSPVCGQGLQAESFGGKPWESPFFFSARCLTEQQVDVEPVLLEENQRQVDDPAFFRMLNQLRHGRASDELLSALSMRAREKWPDDSNLTILTPRNAEADELNEGELAKLASPEFHYEARREGRFISEGNAEADDLRLPSPERLKLRVGARVMFTKNDSQGRWVNGSVGVVVHVDESSIEVVRTDTPVRPKFLVEQVTWERIQYTWDDSEQEVRWKVVGTYKQFPLALAWAVTIHKAQGKTLDKVGIDLRHGAFAAGQVYVALSRSRTLAGIFLREPLRRQDIICDDVVATFYEGLQLKATNGCRSKKVA